MYQIEKDQHYGIFFHCCFEYRFSVSVLCSDYASRVHTSELSLFLLMATTEAYNHHQWLKCVLVCTVVMHLHEQYFLQNLMNDPRLSSEIWNHMLKQNRFCH